MPPLALLPSRNQHAVAVTLAATIWLILNTLLDDAGFANSTTAVVPLGVKYVVVP